MSKEHEQSANDNCNIATLVNIFVIIILLKSKESYSKIILNTKSSAIEILKPEIIYESKIKNNETPRYVDLMAMSQTNENHITSYINNLEVKNYKNPSLHSPRISIIPGINSVIKKLFRRKIHSTFKKNIDKTSTQSSITYQKVDKSQYNSKSNLLSLVHSNFSLCNSKYPITSIMMRIVKKANERHVSTVKRFITSNLELKSFATRLNKIPIFKTTEYDSFMMNDSNESKLALKMIYSPDRQVLGKNHAPAENFSENVYLKTTSGIMPESNYFSVEEEKKDVASHIYRVLPMKKIQYELITQNSLLINKLHRNTHNPPKRRFKNEALNGGVLKKHFQMGAVALSEEQPGRLNNKIKKTKLIRKKIINRSLIKRMNVTSMTKLLQRVMNISNIQSKLVKSDQQQMESRPNAKKQLSKFGFKNDYLIVTTEIPALNQSSTESSNDLHTIDHLVSSSKQPLQFDSDEEQNYSVNVPLKNSENNILAIKVTKKARQTITDRYHEINKVDITQCTKDLTMRNESHASTVNQSKYLPSFNDMENSNSNISLRSMPQVPSRAHNRKKTMKIPKQKVLTKTIGIKGKQTNANKLREKSKTTKATRKESSRIMMYKKMHPIKASEESLKKKQKKKTPLTKVTAKISIKQKQDKKVHSTEVTTKRTSKEKPNIKLKLTSVASKTYKKIKQSKKVAPTNVSIKESIKRKQEKKIQPTKKFLDKKKYKKLKQMPVSIKNFKTSNQNQMILSTKTILYKLKNTSNQRENKKGKYTEASRNIKNSKTKFITKKNDKSFDGMKHIKKAEKSQFKTPRTRSDINKLKKSKSQLKKPNTVNNMNINRPKISRDPNKNGEKTKNLLITTEGYISNKIKGLNTGFVLRSREDELEYKKFKEIYYYYTINLPFNSYNEHFYNRKNYYLYASSAITDWNNINNLVVIYLDTTTTEKLGILRTRRRKRPIYHPHTPPTSCPNRFSPTITFLKRTGIMEFNVIVTSIFMGSVVLVIFCCCCCAPIIIVRKRTRVESITGYDNPGKV